MTAASRKRIAATKHDADLVVESGLSSKNRYGVCGPIPLPDGCYMLVRLDASLPDLFDASARVTTYAAAVARKQAKR